MTQDSFLPFRINLAPPTRPLLALLAAGLLLPAAGCRTADHYRNEVARSRQEATAAWERPAPVPPLLPSDGKLTIAQAVRLALDRNKQLQVARQEREVARGRVLESYGQALPRLSANAAYTRLDEVNQLDLGGRTLSLGFENNYAVDLTLRQPLFHGGAIPAALSAAQLYALWSDETVRAATQSVIFETLRDCYDALLAEKLVAVYEQALRFAETLLEDVKSKRRNGLSSDYDVLRAEVEVSNARAESIRHHNAHRLAVARLLRTLGLPQDTPLALADDLAYEPDSTPGDAAMRVALVSRPDLLQAELALRMQKEAVRAARSAYQPKLDAFVSQKWSNPDPHSAMEDDWGDAWTAGLTASFTLFDGFERRGKLDQEKARLQQAELRLRAAEEAAALEVRQALLSLRDNEELVESQKLNLQRAQEGLRLVQAGYRQGINTEVAVMDAQTALTRTQALYYQALHAHMTARLNLRRAMGLLSPAPSAADGVLPSSEPSQHSDNPQEEP